MKNDRFSGTCIGGPKDGQHVESSSPQYRVALWPDVWHVSYSENPTIDLKVNDFTYYHIRICDAGFWVPLAVLECLPFEHQIYKDEFAYVIIKLAANYRPGVSDAN